MVDLASHLTAFTSHFSDLAQESEAFTHHFSWPSDNLAERNPSFESVPSPFPASPINLNDSAKHWEEAHDR